MLGALSLCIALIIALTITIGGCSNSHQVIDIANPAYMYGDDIDETLPVSMKGTYNKKKHSFRGSMEIDHRIKLDPVMFANGMGIIFFEGSKQTFLGQIYFDNESLNYTIEIIDPVIYEKLTNRPSDGQAKVIISSPSTNLEQAQQVNEELNKMKLPFEL